MSDFGLYLFLIVMIVLFHGEPDLHSKIVQGCEYQTPQSDTPPTKEVTP